jgi:SNF2 family DNA or RNA helicase
MSAPDSDALAAAASAAGVDARGPDSVLFAAAARLRSLLDAGADASDASVAALLQLVNAARTRLKAPPQARRTAKDIARDIDADAAAIADALRLSNAVSLLGNDAAASAIAAATCTEAFSIGKSIGKPRRSIHLLPRLSRYATEQVLNLVRADVALGARAESENCADVAGKAARMNRLRQGQHQAEARKRKLAAVAAAAVADGYEPTRPITSASANAAESKAYNDMVIARNTQLLTPVNISSSLPPSTPLPQPPPQAALPQLQYAPSPQHPVYVVPTGPGGTGAYAPSASDGSGVVPPMNQVQASSLTPPADYSRAGSTAVAAYSAASAPYPPQYLTPQHQQQQKQQLMNGGLRYAEMPPLQQLAMMPPPPPVIDPAVVAANERAAAAVEAMEIVFDPLDRLFGMPAQAELSQPEAVIRAVVADRERTLYRLTQLRQAELLSLPETTSDSLRRKAVIEGKQLKLIELQRRFRHRIVSENRLLLSHPVAEETTVVPADDLARMWRRRDPPVYSYTDGYPRISPVDGLSATPVRTPQAIAIESSRMAQFDYSRMTKQRVEKRRGFLAHLISHQQRFVAHFGSRQVQRTRILRGLDRHWLDKKRAEERRKKQEQVERMRLLRSNDEEAYLKLLKNTKNERLLQLVSQTDNYLMQIGAKVEKTKENAIAASVPIANAFEDEKKAGNDDTVDTMRRRRDMYYTVTHAITEEVRQPSIMVHGTLKPYQVDGLKWMVSLYNNNLNGILADEMGLGKTIQTISLVTYLMETKKNPGPFLIIVPLSTLGNWVREMELWCPSVKKVIYRGDPNTRRIIHDTQVAGLNFNVLLTTYEFVVKDQTVLSRIHWKYIIIDEGHRLKNANCKLAQTLGTRYRSKNRLLLTGTPLQNNLTELWALLNFLLPSIFSSADTFETWFKKPFEQTTMGDTAELEEEETYLIINRLHQVLRPFLLRRLKTDVESQLPDKVESVIKCDMSAWQRVLYRQMQNRIALATGDGAGNSKSFNNLLMQLKKICNHPYIFYGQEAINKLPGDALIRSSGKFVLLAHVLAKLRETGHRTLIFSQMTTALDYLEDFMTAVGILYLRLDGNTKADDRQGMLNDFNATASPYFCFLLSTRAGGLGLNLQTADTVIIFDSDWNPMMDLQAQDRAHRIGQKNQVRVIRLICSGTVETKILDQANRKLHVDAQVIQAGQFNNKATDTDRETMLKTILRQGADETDQIGDNCPSLDEVNRIIARHDGEFELFQEIDAKRAAMEHLETIMVDESELPDWVLQPEVDHKTTEQIELNALETHGRGRRKHAGSGGAEQLTEREWLRVMEGEVSLEEAVKIRRLRLERRRNGGQGDEDDEDDEDNSDGDDDEETKGLGNASGTDDGDRANTPLKSRRRRPSGAGRSRGNGVSGPVAPSSSARIGRGRPRSGLVGPKKRRRTASADIVDIDASSVVDGRPKRRRMNGSTPSTIIKKAVSAATDRPRRASSASAAVIVESSDEHDEEMEDDDDDDDAPILGLANSSKREPHRRRSVMFADSARGSGDGRSTPASSQAPRQAQSKYEVSKCLAIPDSDSDDDAPIKPETLAKQDEMMRDRGIVGDGDKHSSPKPETVRYAKNCGRDDVVPSEPSGKRIFVTNDVTVPTNGSEGMKVSPKCNGLGAGQADLSSSGILEQVQAVESESDSTGNDSTLDGRRLITRLRIRLRAPGEQQ